MLVNPSVPANTVPEFIAHANVIPGKLNMASSGNGTSSRRSPSLKEAGFIEGEKAARAGGSLATKPP
jgi:tripartite-type tricarboxylate transporter receptor subunit TctC